MSSTTEFESYKTSNIPLSKTGFFSKILLDYIEKNEYLKPFYDNFPSISNFYTQIKEKQKSYKDQTRSVLYKVLKSQHKDLVISKKTSKNIENLKHRNTFTVTTGHQLNLFTGPLYFLYKIISTINLCEELALKFPKQNFVPVYWMATEDHDFEEINHFNFNENKVVWNKKTKVTGAVGSLSTDGLDEVYNVLSNHLGNSKNAEFLKKLFYKAYIKHNNLTQATRYFTNELFKDYGLVIIDGYNLELKQLFSPFIKDEIKHQTSYKQVSKTILKLEKKYKIQVNPREINLFYLKKNHRERIILENGNYKINNSDSVYTEEEILKKVDENPMALSPNVIMRPLYQEVVLPSVCYIGGGSEIVYWLQLKEYFDKVGVSFPILLLRNSVQIISKKNAKRLKKLNITSEEIFLKQQELISRKVVENIDVKINFKEKINFIRLQFEELKEVAKKTDASFINAVNAQEKKQIKGLERLQKRLLKAETKRQSDLVERITKLQNKILPNQNLEERQRNFSDYYLKYGKSFIKTIKYSLKPLNLKLIILEL